jgi:branched-chain amino acid transport system ATP-binding protein
MTVPVLEFLNVHAGYRQQEILCDASFAVQPGEILALQGGNGSGKSTVLNVAAGLLQPTQGCVRYQGADLNGLDAPTRQRMGIGYLMQGGRVFPNLSVQENFDLARGCGPAKLGDCFPLLHERRRDRAGLLSGGQRRLLATEMLLAQQPRLLLLDEPTSALAEAFAAELVMIVRAYIAQRSLAAVLVEQNAEACSRWASHCHTLREGQVFAESLNTRRHE